MKSLLFSFLKRAVLIPLLVAALVVFATLFVGNKMVAKSNADASAKSASVNLTGYTVRSYNQFKELKSGGFVGTVACEAAGLGEKAVVYASAEDNSLVMSSKSKEPWKNGGVLISGTNTDVQFKALHNASVGDEIVVSFYDNDSYAYRVQKIVPCADAAEVASYLKDNTLVLSVSFNNFTDLGNAYFYRVVVAQAEQEVQE